MGKGGDLMVIWKNDLNVGIQSFSPDHIDMIIQSQKLGYWVLWPSKN